MRKNPTPQSVLVKYGDDLFNFEQINPPMKAQRKGNTYPIGATNAVGSSVSIAAAVLASINEKPMPTVISMPKKDDLNVLSSELSLFIVLFLGCL